MKKRARAFLDQRETARKNVFADLRHERAPRVFDRLPVLGLASRQFRQSLSAHAPPLQARFDARIR